MATKNQVETVDYLTMNKTELEKILTPKQRIFCEEYVIDWNGTRAAKAAGYSAKTAKAMAYENLTKPYILAYIEKIKGNIEEEANLSKLRIVKEHMKLAFSSISHLHDTWIDRKDFNELTEEQKACIESIETDVSRKFDFESDGEITKYKVKIKLYSKAKALDSLSKLMGYNKSTKVEHSGEIEITAKEQEELDKVFEKMKGL